MYKILLILLFIGLTLPMVASAFLSGPIVECGTKEANRDCTLCDIFVMVKNIIKFLMDLIIVIAPVFVVIGGIIILTGGIKPDQIALGKKIITSALVGIVIALLSWVILGTLFNVLAKPAGEGGMPWAWNKIECVPPEEGEEPEEPEEQIPWCQRSAPSGSSTWILTDPPVGARPEQKGDASPELASFLNCMYLHIHGLRINSISSNKPIL